MAETDRVFPVEAVQLCKSFSQQKSLFPFAGSLEKEAVKDVDFRIRKGEVLALVGESGCGKSTIARMLLGLEKPTKGGLRLFGENVLAYGRQDWLRIRPRIQMIFQNPYASLNPKHKIVWSLLEALREHRMVSSREEGISRIEDLLAAFSLPARSLQRYPHQFSGGQLQRLSIARALLLKPEVLIADEMLSALDVDAKLQIIDLLNGIMAERGLSCLFITHNLGVALRISDRIMVMKDGEILETQESGQLFSSPRTDYTRSLISSIPHFRY